MTAVGKAPGTSSFLQQYRGILAGQQVQPSDCLHRAESWHFVCCQPEH